jgi:hypothetical protein
MFVSRHSNGSICRTAPFLRLFIGGAYRRISIPYFPSAVPVTSRIGFIFLPVARFSRCLLSNCFRCSLLKAARTERFHGRVPVGICLTPSSCFPDRWLQMIRGWSMLLHFRLLIRCKWSLLSFRMEPNPPQCPIIHFPRSMEVPDVLFAISMFWFSLKISLTFPVLSSRNRKVSIRHNILLRITELLYHG